MLMRYLEHEFPQASPSERKAFERLLECTDPNLQEMFLGEQAAPDPDMESIARKIRAARPDHA